MREKLIKVQRIYVKMGNQAKILIYMKVSVTDRKRYN